MLAIVAREGDRHIGVVDLRLLDPINRHATLGIAIGEPAARGQGHGSDALRLILAHAFSTLNLHRVQLGQ